MKKNKYVEFYYICSKYFVVCEKRFLVLCRKGIRDVRADSFFFISRRKDGSWRLHRVSGKGIYSYVSCANSAHALRRLIYFCQVSLYFLSEHDVDETVGRHSN